MMHSGFTRNFTPFNIIPEEQVDMIWDGILDVAENTGLKFDVESSEKLKLFHSSGCNVDYAEKVVKFPRDIVEAALKKCPSSFSLKSRDSTKDIIIGENNVSIQTGPGMQYIDLDTFEPRDPTKKEFYDAVTIYDALPNLHYYHPLSPNSSFSGLPTAIAYLEVLAGRLRNSVKPNSIGSTEPRASEYIVEMAKVVNTPMMWARGAAPPLTWSDDSVNNFIDAIKAGFPLSITSGAIWGSSAPVTIAGAMVSNSVEVLGPVILSQIINPGHPVTVKLFAMPQNMMSGAPLFGNIATAIGNAVFNQIWRRYNIPTTTVESGISNAKCIDYQNGYEKGTLALSAAISGAHAIWIHGTVYGELTAHPVQAIMDDDIAGIVGQYLSGVEVNEETMAIDLIKEIGFGPDFYLNKEHTRKWWKREQYIANVADTSMLSHWLQGGKKTALVLAKEKMDEILAKHKVSKELTASQDQEIERILADARKYYKKIGRL